MKVETFMKLQKNYVNLPLIRKVNRQMIEYGGRTYVFPIVMEGKSLEYLNAEKINKIWRDSHVHDAKESPR